MIEYEDNNEEEKEAHLMRLLPYVMKKKETNMEVLEALRTSISKDFLFRKIEKEFLIEIDECLYFGIFHRDMETNVKQIAKSLRNSMRRMSKVLKNEDSKSILQTHI